MVSARPINPPTDYRRLPLCQEGTCPFNVRGNDCRLQLSRFLRHEEGDLPHRGAAGVLVGDVGLEPAGTGKRGDARLGGSQLRRGCKGPNRIAALPVRVERAFGPNSPLTKSALDEACPV